MFCKTQMVQLCLTKLRCKVDSLYQWKLMTVASISLINAYIYSIFIEVNLAVCDNKNYLYGVCK